MKKLLLFYCSILVFVQLQAQSDKQCPPAKHNPAMRKAMHEHFEKNMKPVLQAKQNEFDAKLSKDDLAFVQTKRQEAAALREEHKTLRKQMRAAVEGGESREAVHQKFETQLQALHQKHHSLHEAMRPFMERNRPTLHPIMEGLKPQHEQWRTERQAIRKQYMGEEMNDKRPEHPHREHHAHKRNPNGHHGHSGGHHALRFVLQDFDDSEDDDDTTMPQPSQSKAKVGQASTEAITTLESFPNPSQQQTTIRFEIAQTAAEARLQLMDSNGKIVRTQNWSNLPAGVHTTTLDVQDLPAGLYIYTLLLDGKNFTKTLVVSKP